MSRIRVQVEDVVELRSSSVHGTHQFQRGARSSPSRSDSTSKLEDRTLERGKIPPLAKLL